MTNRGCKDNDVDKSSRFLTKVPESLQTQPAMLATKATLTTSKEASNLECIKDMPQSRCRKDVGADAEGL